MASYINILTLTTQTSCAVNSAMRLLTYPATISYYPKHLCSAPILSDRINISSLSPDESVDMQTPVSRRPAALIKPPNAKRCPLDSASVSPRTLVSFLVSRSRMFDRDRHITRISPQRSAGEGFATNANLCRTRGLSTRNRRRLLASPNLAKSGRIPSRCRRGDVEAQLEKKVADYLRKSQALEDYWQGRLR